MDAGERSASRRRVVPAQYDSPEAASRDGDLPTVNGRSDSTRHDTRNSELIASTPGPFSSTSSQAEEAEAQDTATMLPSHRHGAKIIVVDEDGVDEDFIERFMNELMLSKENRQMNFEEQCSSGRRVPKTPRMRRCERPQKRDSDVDTESVTLAFWWSVWSGILHVCIESCLSQTPTNAHETSYFNAALTSPSSGGDWGRWSFSCGKAFFSLGPPSQLLRPAQTNLSQAATQE